MWLTDHNRVRLAHARDLLAEISDAQVPSAYRRRVRALVHVHGYEPVVFPGCFGLLARLPASAFRSFGEARPAR